MWLSDTEPENIDIKTNSLLKPCPITYIPQRLAGGLIGFPVYQDEQGQTPAWMIATVWSEWAVGTLETRGHLTNSKATQVNK